MSKYDCLRLDHQLCFPIYACSRGIVKKYKPFLDELDLTYTQYIVMMVLWEKQECNVKELGNALFLDSGTLTPLLKKMEAKGLVSRTRSTTDERNVIICITEEGMKLREQAVTIPAKMGGCVDLSKDEARTLYKLLYKVLANVEK